MPRMLMTPGIEAFELGMLQGLGSRYGRVLELEDSNRMPHHAFPPPATAVYERKIKYTAPSKRYQPRDNRAAQVGACRKWQTARIPTG